MNAARWLAVLACLALLPAQAGAETKIVFNIFTPPSHFMWPEMRGWAKQVSDATQGRVKLEFPAESVAPPPKILEAVKNGSADGGFMFNAFLAPKIKGPMVGQLPWIVPADRSGAASVAMWRTYQKFFADKGEFKDVHLLSLFQWGGAGMCSVTDTPVTTLDDLKKRKLWALAGNVATIVKNLGISFVAGPAVQIHEYVSRNVVDAYTGITWDSIESFKAAPYTKSCLLFDRYMNSANFSLFINNDTWAKLGKADQDAITKLAGEAMARHVGDSFDKSSLEAKDKLAKAGVTFAKVEPGLLEALHKASVPVEAQWIESVKSMGVDGKAAVAFMKSEVDQLSAMK
jgi:TRAP-type C4-dicarboxylate transport system substrate-binding protein